MSQMSGHLRLCVRLSDAELRELRAVIRQHVDMSPREDFMTSNGNVVVQPFSLVPIFILFLIGSSMGVKRIVQSGTRVWCVGWSGSPSAPTYR